MSFPSDELQRLQAGPEPDAIPPGVGVTEIAVRGPVPGVVLDRCRAALLTVADGIEAGWEPDRWAAELPPWLLERFVTEEEKEATAVSARAALLAAEGPEARLAALDALPWTVSNWLWWFQDPQREWWWWDGRVTGDETLTIWVATADVVVAWDALRFLIRAAGAEAVSQVA